MHARMRIPALSLLLLASCAFQEPEEGEFNVDLSQWPNLAAHARPTILRDTREPDPDLQEWKKHRDEQSREEEERLAKQPKVTAAFVDLPLRDALFEISQQSGIPIVVDQTVTGNVTLSLKDTPLESALRLVIFSGSYAWSTDGHAYFVGTVDPQSTTFSTLTTTRVLPTNRPPKEIVASLSKAYANYVTFSEGTNLLNLTGPSSVLDRLESDIRLVDQAPVQILIEVLVVETKFGSDYDIGMDFGEVEATFERQNMRDNNPATVNLKQIDLIGQLAATFDLMQGKRLAEIRSHPKVVTSSGTPAEIRSLVEAYVSIVRTGLTVITSNIEIIKSGTVLKVTPRITRNDEIELTLEPEVADVVGISTEASGSLPVINRRAVKNTVRVKNGDVVIIGGLYEERMRQVKEGIPRLKDVPVLSLFAGRDEGSKSDSELLIFVSPKVVK